MIETVARLDRVAQGKVVRADDIGSLQCDEKRALHGPGADPLDLGKPPDHLLVRQLAQSGLGQASVAEAPRQIQHGGGLAPRQAETTQCPLVDRREFASTRHPAAELLGEARENRGRRVTEICCPMI